MTFFESLGFGFDTDTIFDPEAEFTVSGPGTGTGVTVAGIPTDLGNNTYRYSFTGDFVAGLVFMTFEAGEVTDLGNFSNLEETEAFTVIVDNELPTADLADPLNGAHDRRLRSSIHAVTSTSRLTTRARGSRHSQFPGPKFHQR